MCMFQVFWIYVNVEFEEFEQVLSVVLVLLVFGGWLVVISFYLLEDWIVKNFIVEYSKEVVDCCVMFVVFKLLLFKVMVCIKFSEVEVQVNLCVCFVVLCVVECIDVLLLLVYYKCCCGE